MFMQVASDDSDVEDSDRDEPAAKVKTKKLKVTVVTPKMIALWTKSLQVKIEFLCISREI